MLLVLSGEGATDLGGYGEEIGPLAKLVDRWVERRLGYSLVNCDAYRVFSKRQLVDRAKAIKPRSMKGKKQASETRYFYKNARALALLAQELDSEEMIVVLFRDADGTASSDRGEWQDKWNSMLAGFEIEGMATGVPMIPKPKSEAWLLCALRDGYQGCAGLEEESGNDASPRSLKSQLAEFLGEVASRERLNDLVDRGEIDFSRIKDMRSLTAFTKRLDEVLNMLGVPEIL
jgi:hypothetical protein